MSDASDNKHDDDKVLAEDFKRFMEKAGVTPSAASEDRVLLQSSKRIDSETASLRRQRAETTVLSLSAPSAGQVGPEDVMAWHAQDVPQRLYRRLQDGLLPIDAREDLHELTEERLRQVLPEMIMSWVAAGVQTVLLIHGKSRHSGELPVLKNRLYQWLPHFAEVAAFHSAQTRHGGAGALYLLLRAPQR